MKPSELKAAWLKANLKKGEHYGGILLGNFGEQDYHLILLPGDAEGLTWAKAKEFAKKAGGDLPSRREQSLLFANLKDEFKGTWYWSGEQHASEPSYAWFQYFGDGGQISYPIFFQCRARSVRRLIVDGDAEGRTYREMMDTIDYLIRDLCEIPDRNSPDDQPEMLLVTAAEIRTAIERWIPAMPTTKDAERYRKLRDEENWGDDGADGGGSRWAVLGELTGAGFDAFVDALPETPNAELRGAKPIGEASRSNAVLGVD